MAEKDIILTIIRQIGNAIEVSENLFEDFTPETLGAKLPVNVINAPQVTAALGEAAVAAHNVSVTIGAIDAAIVADNKADILKNILEFAGCIKIYFEAIKKVVDTISAAVATIPDANVKAIATAFVLKLSEKITNLILVNAIEKGFPQLLYLLKILGIAEWNFTNPIAINNVERGFVKKELYLHRIKNFITNPEQHFRDSIKWGANDFNALDFFKILSEFFREEDGALFGTEAGLPFYKRGLFGIKQTASTPPGLEFSLTASLNASNTLNTKISDDWGFSIASAISLIGGLFIELKPPFDIKLLPPQGQISGDIKAFIDRNANKRPFNVIGNSNDLLMLELENFTSGVGLKASWDVVNAKATIEPIIFIDLKKLTLKIGSANADSFIGKILANAEIEGTFDLGLEWTFSKGLKIKASGGIEIAIPIHQNLGILEIDIIYIALNIRDNGVLALESSVSFKGLLGPLTVTVERIGAKCDVSFPENSTSKFGFFDVDFGFKPPSGLGLAINAGAVIGGGYLFFDFDKEEYAGVLELTIAGFISAKAIGLITTKMPDGSKGFSMLIIITAEFMPPFQLGYGFTLNAVGGLLGLNRTMLLDPLRNAVRTGAVNSIMFPQNVIANAPRIISDLKAIFPAYEGKFLIGPMAKIGWGTPTLISLSLGIIIEIPGNIAILGVLKVALPTELLPLVQIQVLFVGTIDFDKKMLTFDASLYESFILTMTLEGDMAVRLKWGDNPDFLITVGGFHPSFTPPPLALPALRRLAISILNTSIALIRVECYQAVTSNTVQFGAKAEIKFDLSVCKIEGHIGFDALIQFNPFYFIIEVSASFKLSAAGIDILSVRVRMSLEGPTPWRARGTGSVSILFFEISADFDITWGDNKNTSIPDISILEQFITDIQKKENWNTVLTNNKNLLVTLRKFKEEANPPLVLHPAGALVLQQKKLPLQVKIDKVGSQKVNDVQKITIAKASSSGVDLVLNNVEEDFARAQYQVLSDAEKLSKPSFEKMPGGVKISLGAVNIKNGKFVRKNVAYEITIIDKEPTKPFFKGILFKQIGILFNHFLKGNSVSKSVLSKSYAEKVQPFADKLEVAQEGYTVAFQANNKAHTTTATFASEIMAQTYLQEQVALQPNLRQALHIIPNYELQQL
jgi:hypothetical protein